MKSRISFFNKTVFRKNFTRFAPAWGLFTVILTLAVFTNCSFNIRRAGSSLLELGQIHCIQVFFYAPLCAQLLFGDLFNARMCNALHAFPLRRETWFGTHVFSGFVFHLIPAVSATALAWLLLFLGGYEGNMAVVPLFLLMTVLEFTFCFGIAVFSIFFAGSRFAHGVVYLLLNFASIILGWLISCLYAPQFYGIQVDMARFRPFAPVSYMLENPFLKVEQISATDANWNRIMVDSKNIIRGDGFAYFFIAAAVGVLLLLGALWLYRRRKLETAGDFLAIRGVAPVFSLVYTLALGAVFYSISDGIFLIVGLIVGWFTSQMLLERTVRVFKKKNFLRCGAVIGVFLLTLGIASLDPLGLEKWVPEEDEVQSVTIYEGHYQYSGKEAILELEKPEDIAALIDIHQDCLDYYYENTDNFTRIALVNIVVDYSDKDSVPLTLSYQLKNGRTVTRYYYIRGQETLNQLKLWLNTPEMVFGEDLTEEQFLAQNLYVEWHKANSQEKKTVFGEENLQALYRAILADCEAGTMQQELNNYTAIRQNRCYTLTFSSGLKLTVYEESTNTMQWIKQHK